MSQLLNAKRYLMSPHASQTAVTKLCSYTRSVWHWAGFGAFYSASCHIVSVSHFRIQKKSLRKRQAQRSAKIGLENKQNDLRHWSVIHTIQIGDCHSFYFFKIFTCFLPSFLCSCIHPKHLGILLICSVYDFHSFICISHLTFSLICTFFMSIVEWILCTRT